METRSEQTGRIEAEQLECLHTETLVKVRTIVVLKVEKQSV